MKLFQIEEPDGGPADPGAPGAAIGIDASGTKGEVAVSVGGNAVILTDREGFEPSLPVPGVAAGKAEWREWFEGTRIRAERVLARPVTHAAIVLAGTTDARSVDRVREASEDAGLEVLRFVLRTELPPGPSPAIVAAMLAEDLAPRPDLGD